MRRKSIGQWLLLTAPWLAAVAWAADDLPTLPMPPLPANPSPAPAASSSAPAPFTMDDWEAHMPSPITPTRNGNTHRDDRDTASLQSNLPPADASVTSLHLPDLPTPGQIPKGDNDNDRLAAIAQADRDFFQTVAKNPQTWPDAERDRRAQAIHDQYYFYIVNYPADVNAIVLYGKLLTRIGLPDLAYEAFRHADQLDPNLAVVKQQLANHLAETGQYAPALEFLRRAVALAPAEPLYHYQIGELLNIYYTHFIAGKIFTQAGLNQTMEAEFARAAALAPQEPGFAWRHAECFYDMIAPDWNAALAAWSDLAQHTTNPTLLEMIRLHRARALLELGRLAEARALVVQPVAAALEASRAELARRLATPAPTLPLPAPAASSPAS
jgi:tetratricopeptide (TPR) repeat protein